MTPDSDTMLVTRNTQSLRKLNMVLEPTAREFESQENQLVKKIK